MEKLSGVNTYNVRDFGAKGDGVQIDTETIQETIDRCASNGGGTVLFPNGVYLTGTIFLKTNVTLHLAPDAVIAGSGRMSDYCDKFVGERFLDGYDRMLICANNQKNISITGTGTINGMAETNVFLKDDEGNDTTEKPMLLRFINCSRVNITGVVCRESYAWGLHLVDCDHVWFDKVTVDSVAKEICNDGFDIEDCHDVFISNCELRTSDDSICIKSTCLKTSYNITVTNCVASSKTAAFKLGTGSVGGFRNITVSNCVFHHCNTGAVKLIMVDGGYMENISISNIVMDKVDGPFFIRLADRQDEMRIESRLPLSEIANRKSYVNNINISNIIAYVHKDSDDEWARFFVEEWGMTQKAVWGIMIAGIPGARVENVTFNNVRVKFPGGCERGEALDMVQELEHTYPDQSNFGILPAYGAYVRHAKGIRFNNVAFELEKSDERTAVVCEDVEDISFDGLEMVAGEEPLMSFKDIERALISRCRINGKGDCFAEFKGEIKDVLITGNDFRNIKSDVVVGESVDAAEIRIEGNIK